MEGRAMKKADVQVGNEYLAKVSGKLQRVRVTRERTHDQHAGPRGVRTTRWEAKNLKTGRTIVIKSAQRLRPLGRSLEHQQIHAQLGCHSCRWADRQALDRGPCCMKLGGPEVDNGKCLVYAQIDQAALLRAASGQ
jgi:hypothetical protein